MENLLKKTLLMMMLLILVTGCGCQKKEENDLNEKKPLPAIEIVIENDRIDSLKFSNFKIEKKNGETAVSVEVSNITEEAYQLDAFDIIVKDTNENEIMKLQGYPGIVNPLETKLITVYTMTDLGKVAFVRYEKVQN